VTQVYSHRGTRLSEVPTSSAELSSDVSSSSLEMPSSPPVASSSLIGSSPEQLLGRGQRIRRPPNCYSPSAFTATALSEPASYRDAILHPEWQHAMAEEITCLERTGTWDLVPCPPRVRPITCKWVYKVKTRSNDSLERYKTRLVARGFQQEHGRDYDETFAPAAHMTTIHTLLAVTSVRGWSISQLDVKNVFLNGELREDVYMHPHLGILSLRAWFVIFVAPFMALSRLLGLGFSVLPLWSQLLVFPPVLMIRLFLSTCHLVVGPFSFFTWMT
jgi:hypothetical protein